MKTVTFALFDLLELHRLAVTERLESCAVGFVQGAGEGQDGPRYTVRDVMHAPETAYLDRSPTRASLSPEFMVTVANRARALKAGVVMLHTHPGMYPLEGFSSEDDHGEAVLQAYFAARLPRQDHFTAVATHAAVHMRDMGGTTPVVARAVGASVRRYAGADDYAEDARYDRQVCAFGLDGQASLRNMAVAVVGLGGTGSIVAQQLAHLGVGRLLLIDHDVVDRTNLNRLLGATPSDVGKPKVEVARDAVRAINPGAHCEALEGDVVNDTVAGRLPQMDFIFGCTDSMASRSVLNQLAYQYLIPAIDMGVAIHVVEGHIASVTGRVQMLAPGLGCLVCGNAIDGQAVRWEMMTPAQRHADPYFVGASVPQPAVLPLNGTVTSMAVTMFLSALTSYPTEARLLHYDGIRGSVRPQVFSPRPNCIVCSPEGALARGISWSLPGRHEHVES
ncbi:MAG: ThiF family adenylyltransferase [Rhizobacter sp.]